MDWIKIESFDSIKNLPHSQVAIFSDGNIFWGWMYKIEITKMGTKIYFTTNKTETNPAGEIINATHYMIINQPL